MSIAVDAETIKQGSRAVRVVTQPHVFPAFISLAAMAVIGVLIYWTRQDAIEQRTAFLAALNHNTEAVEKLSDRVAAQGAIVEAVKHEVERMRDRGR